MESIFYTIVFTLWLIAPANETFEGIVEGKMPGPMCLGIAQIWAQEPVGLNVKRAEYRCVPVVDIRPFMQGEPETQSSEEKFL